MDGVKSSEKKDKLKSVSAALKKASLKAKLPSAKSGQSYEGSSAKSYKSGILYTPEAEMDLSEDMESNESREVEKQHGASEALKKSMKKLKKSRYMDIKNGSN